MAKEITLSGDVGFEITARELDVELKKANGADVLLLINSRGGFVFEGIEIFNLIRSYKGHIEARIVGLAASAASYIILAADKVTAFDNAAFFIHNAINIVFGNHNDMRKMADDLEGLSNMLAKAYVNKSGKSTKEIKALMDEETIFFADEILEAGFVDEIVESEDVDNSTDKASAIITARASMDSCLVRMRESGAANKDLEKAVAYVNGMSALMEAPKKQATVKTEIKPAASGGNNQTPAGAGINEQEDKHMTLKELLATDATAKAEHDVLMSTARAEGEASAKDEMKAVIAKVSPIITSEAYGADVKAAGIEAITGDGHIATFETLVKITDRDIEKNKAELAAKALADGGDGGDGGDGLETPGGEVAGDAQAKADFDDKKKAVRDQGGF